MLCLFDVFVFDVGDRGLFDNKSHSDFFGGYCTTQSVLPELDLAFSWLVIYSKEKFHIKQI
jgi:hypothetical protein